MDPERASSLIQEAFERGLYGPKVSLRLDHGPIAVQSHPVRRERLLGTYARRLKGLEPDSPILDVTRRLVEFLSQSQDENLVMFSAQDPAGNYEMFLADASGRQVVFWMSMFSRSA